MEEEQSFKKILEESKKQEKRNKIKVSFFVLIPIFLAAIFVYTSLEKTSMAITEATHEVDSLKVIVQNDSILLYEKDSIISESQIFVPDMVNVEMKNMRTAKKYFEMIRQRNIASLEEIIEDTLERYNGTANITRENVRRYLLGGWEQSPKLKNVSVEFQFFDEDPSRISIVLFNTKDSLDASRYKKSWIVFKFSQEGKINYIRSFEDEVSFNYRKKSI